MQTALDSKHDDAMTSDPNVLVICEERQKIAAIAPQTLIHLFHNSTIIVGAVFSLNHYQVDNLYYHEVNFYIDYHIFWYRFFAINLWMLSASQQS
ncbi:hypothetical protein L1987_50130 [Smallanthus sonchifolius]|uniref:Uncharacterized protein n=1 Tax=Smallanthus sonchifolius TaxID=185202 RepID=A0ACB9FX73_9ASTR|nr:hypothetical protein L1987_50130 [Smallanthus sonchifolius]